MTKLFGKGRYATGTYPERQPAGPPTPEAAFVFDQNTDSFNQINGNPSVEIATATITLAEGSRVKVEGMTTIVGSVAAGRAFIQAADEAHAPFGSNAASQSFNTTAGTNFRTLNYLGFLDPQPAGELTVTLIIDVNGSAGARVDSSGTTVLILTEIPE